MMAKEAEPLYIPLINPNEREAILVKLHVLDGQAVKIGDLVATVESTKTTLEIQADQPGFVLGLAKNEGDVVLTGEILCYISQSKTDSIPAKPLQKTTQFSSLVPEKIRITKPALALAQKEHVNLTQFLEDQLITEAMIRSILRKPELVLLSQVSQNSLVLFGGGGHGKSLVELIRAEGIYELVGIIDDGRQAGDDVLGIPVLGGSGLLEAVAEHGVKWAVNGVGGIGNLSSRLRVFEKLKITGFTCPRVIHPRALCEPSAKIENGAQIFGLSYIGSSSVVGLGCIINTGVIISHDCRVGEFTNISPGAVLAGNVVVGEQVLVGMGVTINLNVRIGSGARIGNGATIKSDVPENSVVKAGSVWPL